MSRKQVTHESRAARVERIHGAFIEQLGERLIGRYSDGGPAIHREVTPSARRRRRARTRKASVAARAATVARKKHEATR